MELEITTSFLKILLKFRCLNCKFSSFEVKEIQDHLFGCTKRILNDPPDLPVVKEETEDPQLLETMPDLNPELVHDPLQTEAENPPTLVREIRDLNAGITHQTKTESPHSLVREIHNLDREIASDLLQTKLQEPQNPLTLVNQVNLENIKEELMDTSEGPTSNEFEVENHIKPDFQIIHNFKNEVNQTDTNRDYLGMRFHCKRCDKCYRLESHANEHLEKCKNISKENIKKIVKDPGCHNCKYCNNCYDKIEPLETHIEVVHHGLRYQCDKCLRTFKHKNLKRFHFCTGSHYTLHPEKLYHCKHCDKSYTHEFHLKRHINSGHVSFHHECKKCRKEFLNEKNIFFQFCYSCRNTK